MVSYFRRPLTFPRGKTTITATARFPTLAFRPARSFSPFYSFFPPSFFFLLFLYSPEIESILARGNSFPMRHGRGDSCNRVGRGGCSYTTSLYDGRELWPRGITLLRLFHVIVELVNFYEREPPRNRSP